MGRKSIRAWRAMRRAETQQGRCTVCQRSLRRDETGGLCRKCQRITRRSSSGKATL
jgi:predicted amidophosphoribosyltransferase